MLRSMAAMMLLSVGWSRRYINNETIDFCHFLEVFSRNRVSFRTPENPIPSFALVDGLFLKTLPRCDS